MHISINQLATLYLQKSDLTPNGYHITSRNYRD